MLAGSAPERKTIDKILGLLLAEGAVMRPMSRMASWMRATSCTLPSSTTARKSPTWAEVKA